MSYALTLIIALVGAIVGSINGLGVTLIISSYLLLMDFEKIHSHLWIPYLSTAIIASIFLLLRLRLWLNNIIPVFQLTLTCALGLLLGKILVTSINLEEVKLAIGLLISFITFIIWKLNYLSLLGKEIFLEHDWNFTFIDYFVFVVIGLFAGTFEFSLAAFLYAYLIFRQKHYQVESLDVAIYSVLICTSVINLMSTLYIYEGAIPESVDLIFFVTIILGALIGKLLYKFISIELRKKIIFTSLIFVEAKLVLLSAWMIIFKH